MQRQWLKKAFVAFVILMEISCQKQAMISSSTKNLFQNSLRRDAFPAEASHVVSLDTGCTGFFIENTSGKVLVGTATHCMHYKMDDWCQAGKFKDNDGHTGQCDKIEVTDPESDLVIFSAKDFDAQAITKPLRLAAYQAQSHDSLIMIGYPGDENKRGRLTVTEHCWVLQNHLPSPYPAEMPQLHDVTFTHNCSTYGGNSGGPMILRGTYDVVGEPYTYIPNNLVLFPDDGQYFAASAADMSQFVARHHDDLLRLGVAISQSPQVVADTASSIDLQPQEETFYQQCLQLNQDQTSTSKLVRHLVEVTGETDCKRVVRKLGTVSELALENLDLSNLTAFGTGLFDENLKILYLDGNPITDISPLKSMKGLKALHLDHCGFHDVEQLTTLRALAEVSLMDNGIEDISGFSRNEGTIKLKKVYLDGNRISDASSATLMAEQLTITFNRNRGDNRALIDSLSMAGLKIKILGLGDLELNDLAGLPWDAFSKLKALNLGQNRITNIQPLEPLKRSLSNLGLDQNQISDLSVLGQFIFLSDLNLQANLIRDVQPLKGLNMLQNLNLKNNQVEDWTSIAGIPALISLDVQDNPGTVSGQCPHPNAQCQWDPVTSK